MGWLVAFSVIATFLCFRYLFGAMDCLRRGRILRAGGAGLGCVVSAALAGAGVMLLLSYMSYGRLTAEQEIARVEFRQVSADEFQARLMIDREQDRLFLLRGDEWQMDARIVSWTPPATILGLDPMYRLERLSGRYADIRQEHEDQRTVYSLTDETTVDVWDVARRFPVLLPGVDAYYGTATYLPMEDGARFEINMSRDALVARPLNRAAREAVGRWETIQE